MSLPALYVFTTLTGYIIGLGGVTVVNLLGFLGRKNSYWTEIAIRSHKVMNVLIWIGISLKVLGEYFLYQSLGFPSISVLLFMISGFLIANGCILSFYVSPRLVEREKEGRAAEVLPKKLRNLITVSFVVSFIGWWSSVLISSWLIYLKIFEG